MSNSINEIQTLSESIVEREFSKFAVDSMVADGVNPIIARLLSSRGVDYAGLASPGLMHLLPIESMKGLKEAAILLDDSIKNNESILIVADYDCDGATACSVAVKGLRMFGANVNYLVPNRFVHGYGLTPTIVTLALSGEFGKPDMLVTVDNGIASVDGVAAAKKSGLKVLVTDHHLAGDVIPKADAIVNPNQPGCNFESKNMAGVGVMFYTLLALKSLRRKRGDYNNKIEPPLHELLDLVATGTVADVVKLDKNNRTLVGAGLRRIRSGKACPGLQALIEVAGKKSERLSSTDIAFNVGPRINAAGRLADMRAGIECLLSETEEGAKTLAKQLNDMNIERRSIEGEMRDEAMLMVDEKPTGKFSLVVQKSDWHEGVIGLVAGKLKEKWNRPVIAFSPSDHDKSQMKGSGRSIPGVHLRDVLDVISKRSPGIISKFGGHAMAAGLTIDGARLDEFSNAFESAVVELADEDCFTRKVFTDGGLSPQEISIDLVEELDLITWGQGFPAPLFCDEFEVVSKKIIGEKHTKLVLSRNGSVQSAIAFNRTDDFPDHVKLTYRLSRNEWKDRVSVDLLVEDVEKAMAPILAKSHFLRSLVKMHA